MRSPVQLASRGRRPRRAAVGALCMQMPPSEPGDADYPKTRLNALSSPAAADDLDADYSGEDPLCIVGMQCLPEESELSEVVPDDRDSEASEALLAAKTKTRAVLLAVAALYGTNFGSIKVMQEVLVPSDAALLRFTLALAALSPFLRSVPKEMWKPGVGIGVWVALGYIAQGVGLDSGSDASTAAFLCALAVVVCPLLDLLDGKPVAAKTWRAAALAVGGVGVLELGGAVQPSVGDLWSLLQPLGFGLGFWKIEKVMKDFPGLGKELTAVQLVVVWLVSALWVALDHQGQWDVGAIQASLSNLNVAGAVVWTGLVTTALTVLLQTTSLGVLSSSETTVLSLSVTLSSALKCS